MTRDWFPIPPENNPSRSLLVYCVQRLSDNSWIFLNREYKPIGYHIRQENGRYPAKSYFVDYKQYPHRYMIPELTHDFILDNFFHPIMSNISMDYTDRFYLYAELYFPWTSKELYDEYCDRLWKLMSLETIPATTTPEKYWCVDCFERNIEAENIMRNVRASARIFATAPRCMHDAIKKARL